jgi:hypothetical protein
MMTGSTAVGGRRKGGPVVLQPPLLEVLLLLLLLLLLLQFLLLEVKKRSTPLVATVAPSPWKSLEIREKRKKIKELASVNLI